MKRNIKKNLKFTVIKFFNNHKKIRLCSIVAFVCVGSFLLMNFGLFVKDIVENHLVKSKEFYFTSDKLMDPSDNKIFGIDKWGGTTSYQISIQMSSLLNDLKGVDYDINYDVECASSNTADVVCSFDSDESNIISKTNRTIKTSADNLDSFNVWVFPKRASYDDGDTMSVKVTATAKEPYTKTISATFKFTIGSYGLNYQIDDSKNDSYLSALVTNTRQYYLVKTAFTNAGESYAVNDHITKDAYDELSDALKANCVPSAKVKLSFDSSKYRIDTTSVAYANRVSQTTETLTDGYDYINSVTLYVEAESSIKIKFYKLEKGIDHTWPLGTDTEAAITMEEVTATE